MDDARPRNPDSWEPPGLGAALVGHLVLGVVKAPVVLVLLGLATLLPAVPSPGAGGLVALVAVAIGVGALIEVLVEDPFARRRRLSSPGGWDFALVPPLVALVGVVALGWLMSRSLAVGVAVGAAWGLASAVGIAIGRPWEPGMTQDEHDAKWIELKDMTRETFAPDVEEIRRRAGERSMQRYRDAIERKRREQDSEGG
ncbi:MULTISPECIES: hypothetical protein [Clavibacter]|uniref:Uncharacterized protein n=1 Tax=Clavibacter tessellarius TaxID=31965 RepID=A0A154V1M7_9MICO|nr:MULTISPECIES: hypothetical protein [Clavibacter]KZC95273.1 hypothetical protein AWH51_09025 [Clavibacter michiganensis subsp. tessellarius]MDA3803878.1 hypothetical protein [Clavibacter sp. CT19]